MDQGATFTENLNRLKRFFSRQREAGYAFAVASDESMIPEINNKLTGNAQARGKRLVVVSLEAQQEATLMQQLEAQAAEADGLLVQGLITRLNTVGTPALLELNFSREALHALKLPILFWIDAVHLRQLSRQAADLYSRRRLATLFFEKPLDTARIALKLQPRFQESYRSSEEYQRLQRRLALLEVQYEEAQDLPKARLLMEYLLPLAKAYSELDLHQAAMEVMEPHLPELLEQPNPTVLQEVGDMLYAAVQYELAEKAYERALEKLEEGQQKMRSYLLIQLGDLCKDIGRVAEANGYYEQALKLNQQRIEELSTSTEVKKDLAISYSKLGDLLKAQGKFEQALGYFQKCNELGEELHASNPQSESLKRGLAISYERMGNLLKAQGQFEQALGYFQQETTLFEELYASNPQSESLKHGLAISYSKLGDLYQAQGKFEQALGYFQQETTLFEELYASNPQSESLKRGLAISYERMGDLLKAQGQFEQALGYFQKCNELGEELYASNPQSESLKEGLAISYSKLGDLLKAQGKFEQALGYFQKYNELGEELYASNPYNYELANGLAISYYKLAEGLRANEGEVDQIRTHYEQARQLWEPLHQTTNLKMFEEYLQHLNERMQSL